MGAYSCSIAPPGLVRHAEARRAGSTASPPPPLPFQSRRRVPPHLPPQSSRMQAKQQVARVDDLMAIKSIRALFEAETLNRLFGPDPRTLRHHLRKLMQQWSLEDVISLASLRGGATAYHATEDPDWVCSRGGWLSVRTLQVYVQEVQARAVWTLSRSHASSVLLSMPLLRLSILINLLSASLPRREWKMWTF